MADCLFNVKQNEPKRKNRFLIRFPSDLGIAEYNIESASRPSYKSNVVDVPFLNTSDKIVGRYSWDPITVTFRDLIGPSTAQAIQEWVRLISESPTGRQGYAAGYKRDVEIEMLDPTGVCVEKWILVDAFPSDSSYGDLSYSDDSLANITVTLQFYYAILAY